MGGGLLGLASGVGKGLVGVVTKPVSGIADLNGALGFTVFVGKSGFLHFGSHLHFSAI